MRRIIHPRRTSAFRAVETGFPASVCFDLDATDATSTGTANEWKNLIASPADGASQTDYDFFLGESGASDSAEPTLTNTGGDAYFACDGGDYCTAKDGVGHANTPMLRDAAENGAGIAWWIAFAFRTPSTLANSQPWGNASVNTTTGIRWANTGTGTRINIQAFDNTDSSGMTQELSVFSVDTDHLLIVTTDMNATSNNYNHYLNSDTPTNSQSVTYNSNSLDTDGVFRIGASDDEGTVGNIVPNGWRLYGMTGGNSFLTDAQAANIRTVYNDRLTPSV